MPGGWCGSGSSAARSVRSRLPASGSPPCRRGGRCSSAVAASPWAASSSRKPSSSLPSVTSPPHARRSFEMPVLVRVARDATLRCCCRRRPMADPCFVVGAGELNRGESWREVQQYARQDRDRDPLELGRYRAECSCERWIGGCRAAARRSGVAISASRVAAARHEMVPASCSRRAGDSAQRHVRLPAPQPCSRRSSGGRAVADRVDAAVHRPQPPLRDPASDSVAVDAGAQLADHRLDTAVLPAHDPVEAVR